MEGFSGFNFWGFVWNSVDDGWDMVSVSGMAMGPSVVSWSVVPVVVLVPVIVGRCVIPS